MKKILSIALVLLVAGHVVAQTNFYNKENYFTIVSYNVENLFDTINDPNKEDDEFTPTSEKNWNSEKYYHKLDNIARVISSVNKNELPEIVGLVEIENQTVLEDLVSQKFLAPGNYGIVHEESPDARGIDVALLYRKSDFKYIEHQIIRVDFDFEPATKTRDILYVKGSLNDNEILHVFVNHWSSRRDGAEASEPKRVRAAELLRGKVDEILAKDSKAKIVIIGDFNDEPTNKSIHEVLNATNNQFSKNKKELYNLLYDKHLFGYGTYNYKGDWNMIDNIIVSQALLNNDGKYCVSTDGGQIFEERWMMYDNAKTGQMTPNRTYGGPYYHGGFSDHLPVYLVLKKQ